MDTFTAWMNTLNGFVWGPAMLVLILGTGLYLQLRLLGMPIRRIGAGLRLVWKGRDVDPSLPGEVSPFSALMTCLAAKPIRGGDFHRVQFDSVHRQGIQAHQLFALVRNG